MTPLERDAVAEQVRAVAGRLLDLPAERLTGDTRFDEDLGLDSLTRVEVALALEDVFDVELPEEVVTALDTVDDLVDAVLLQASVHAPAPYPLDVVVETWNGGPALSYAGRPRTVVDVLHEAVLRDPHRDLLLLPDGTRVQRRDFADLVEGAAHRLRERGLGPGDVVAVVARNGLELAVAQFACARAHLVMCGLNVHQAPSLWTWLVESSGARLVLATPEFAERLELPSEDAAGLLLGPARPWAYDPDVDRPDEAAAYCLVHTSGTTGRPKAVRIVHRASVHSAMSYAHLLALQPDDVSAVLFPLYYVSAMHAHLLPALLTGGSCLLLPGATPTSYVEALEEHRVSWAYAVPSFWQLVVRRGGLSAERLPHLRRVGMGGSPWPPGMEATLRELLPATRLYDVYGLSETHSPATMLLDEDFAGHAGSIGRALPCVELRTDGDPGELLVRGSLVTTGYEGDPEATAAAISDDGWFRTGDVATIDADGFVRVLDRVKDMVNRGGHKVFSAELERVLREHPSVADAAVVGLPDAVGEELVVAFLVAEPGAEVLAADVRRHVAGTMADYAVPRFVHVVDELPRGATGKTDKAALRERASRGG